MNSKNPDKHKAGFIDKLNNRIRYNLVMQVIKNRLAAIGFEFTAYYIFRESTDDLETPDIKGKISDYKVEFLKVSDMKTIGSYVPGYSTEQYLEHLRLGRKCIGLKYKGKIISFVWFDFNEVNFKPNKFKLQKNEVYSYNICTLQPYRGQNIAPYLKISSYKILNRMGIDTCYSIIEVFNSSSLRYRKKLKSKKIKLGLFIRLFKKYEWIVKLKSYK